MTFALFGHFCSCNKKSFSKSNIPCLYVVCGGMKIFANCCHHSTRKIPKNKAKLLILLQNIFVSIFYVKLVVNKSLAIVEIERSILKFTYLIEKETFFWGAKTIG